MIPVEAAFLALLIFATAVLFSSVGQAGASGYLAAMLLMGVSAAAMRPAALLLNVGVAAIATIKFHRSGAFSWRALWPFAAASAPMSFVGGSLSLAPEIYKPVIGVILVIAAIRLLLSASTPPLGSRAAPIGAALLAGGAIGLVSGLTGIGGGILLTPLLLFTGWAEPREAAGISAAFILLNSVAALLAQPLALSALPEGMPVWAICAIAGGWIGAEYGSRRLDSVWSRRALAVVLLIAAARTLAI